MKKFFLVLILNISIPAFANLPDAAAHQDYQNLIVGSLQVDASGAALTSASQQAVKDAFNSLDKILSQQQVLSEGYATVVRKAEQEIALIKDRNANLSIYHTIENRIGIFAREYQSSSGVSTLWFENYTMRNDEYKDRFNTQTTDSLVLQRELSRLLALAIDKSSPIAKAVQDEVLLLLEKYDVALDSKITTLVTNSSAGVFANKDRIIANVLGAFIYKLAAEDSLSPNEQASRTALSFLVKVKKIKLSAKANSLIEAGLSRAANYSGQFLVVRNSQFEYVDANEEIARRKRDPAYSAMFDQVFASSANGKLSCSLLFF